MGATDLATLIDRVQDGLAGRAFLYDSPQDYRSGVEDAIQALTHGAEIQFDGDRPVPLDTLERTLKMRLAR
ncbi:MAG: hypothetical protein WD770_09485 [Actinomycetota bacterium]